MPEKYKRRGLGLPGRERRTRASSRSTSSRARRRSRSTSSKTCSRRPTSSIWRRTKTARERPSVGTSARCSSRRCRSTGSCSTKSPKRRSTRRLRIPAAVDEDLVRAQETRRILDRLYGYEVSPLLWRKVRPRLSAGRVQSVAVRLIVERERERMAFVSATYWDLLGTFAKAGGESFQAVLVSVDGRKIPAGRDFDPATGKLKDPALLLLDEAQAAAVDPSGCMAGEFRGRERRETSRTRRSRRRRSPPARCSRRRTASSASPPGGRCRWPRACTKTATSPTCVPTRPTWPRWRSTRPAIWSDATTAASTCRPSRDVYKTKVKNAQEAHEAIRPAGHPFGLPGDAARRDLSADEFKLYDLIWKRTIASQMADARGRRITITVEGGRRDLPGQRQDDRLPRLPAGLRRGFGRSGRRTGRPGRRAAGGRRGRDARVPRARRQRATRRSRRAATAKRR